MSDQTITKALNEANAAQFVMGLQDVGIVALALLLIVFVGGKLLKRYLLDDTKMNVEGNLYGHMDDRIAKLEGLLDTVSAENKTLILNNANMSARIALLEQHEAEVTKLKRILDNKDARIAELEDRIDLLERKIAECKCNILR